MKALNGFRPRASKAAPLPFEGLPELTRLQVSMAVTVSRASFQVSNCEIAAQLAWFKTCSKSSTTCRRVRALKRSASEVMARLWAAMALERHRLGEDRQGESLCGGNLVQGRVSNTIDG